MTQRIQRHPYLAVFDGADPIHEHAAADLQHHAAAGALSLE
jgi:hypothetical protein